MPSGGTGFAQDARLYEMAREIGRPGRRPLGAQTTFYDMAGTELGSGCATAVGHRFAFD